MNGDANRSEEQVTIVLRARHARLIEAHLQAHLNVHTFDKATEPAVVEFLDQVHASLPDTAVGMGEDT